MCTYFNVNIKINNNIPWYKIACLYNNKKKYNVLHSFTFISNNCKPQSGCSFINLIAKQAPSTVMGFFDI